MKNIHFEKTLVGGKVSEIKRTCDLVMFCFKTTNEKKLFLHTQCLLRIFDSDNTLVICTQNLLNRSPNYRKKWFKKYDWTCIGATVFDDAIKDYQDRLMATTISSVVFDHDDIKISFENGMRMDVLVVTTKYDDLDYVEDYRIFDEDKSKGHYVVPLAKANH